MTRPEPETPSPEASWATWQVPARATGKRCARQSFSALSWPVFNVEKFSLERLRSLTFTEVILRYQEFEQLTRFESFSSESLDTE